MCLSLMLLHISSPCHWKPSYPSSISHVLKTLRKVAWLFPPNSMMQTLEPVKGILLRYREFGVWSKAFLIAQILISLLTANIPLVLLPLIPTPWPRMPTSAPSYQTSLSRASLTMKHLPGRGVHGTPPLCS